MTWLYTNQNSWIEEPNVLSNRFRPKPKLVITSGHLDPCHYGHFLLIKEAAKLGDYLWFIVNSDHQVFLKRGKLPFIKEEHRREMVESVKYVDYATIAIDKDGTVTETLELIFRGNPDHDFIFAKGGDRVESNMPQSELDVCKKYGCKIVYGIGGDKIASSSDYKG